MEKVKSVISKSSISSLKFERKSDYKKFLNFIKKETKELKEIETPKENVVKKLFNIGAAGVGFGLIGIFAGSRRGGDDLGEDDGTGSGIGDYAVGRRNIDDPGNDFTYLPPRFSPDRRARKYVPTNKVTTGANITRPTKALIPKLDEPELRGERNIKARKITKTFADVEKKYVTKTVDGVDVKVPKDSNTQNIVRTKKFKFLPESIKLSKQLAENVDALSETVDTLSEADAAKDALRDIKEGGKFGNITEDVSSRAKDVRAKKLAMQDAMRDFKIQSAQDDLLKKVFKQEKKFKNTRPFQNIFSSKTYGNYDPQGRITSTISENPYKGKSPFSKLTRRFTKGNPKITSDFLAFRNRVFKGITYKGPKFSLLSNLTANPVVKAGFFFLDAYAAYQSGKQVFNFKDNIGTALYDLGVAINNQLIHPNDPSKLMLYISESSNKNLRTKQLLRNQRIKELKQSVEGSGENNVLIVPTETSQSTSSSSNIPTKIGGNEVSFLPFEPLNIGEDILLQKLNQ